MKVKICGITCLEDSYAALEAGADLLGFNFYPPSPRYITPGDCAALLIELRRSSYPFQSVGVFVNEPAAMILSILQQCSLDLAQLHGDEPLSLLEDLPDVAYKAIRPTSLQDALDQAARYARRGALPALLVDAARPQQYGGTGQTADWEIGGALAEKYPVLLAGGLNPANVAAAVAAVQPWGVDVASGVESAPGRKDPIKLNQFVRAARSLTGEA